MKKSSFVVFLLLLVIAATVLSACGECSHDYVDGTCSKCGDADPNYNKPCTHTYLEGICSICGEACDHDYENGTCSVCGETCDHDYANGICSICGDACDHDYTNETCSVCGKACDHDYTNGTCSVCGFADPDYVPADGGASLYDDIIDDFKYLVLYKYVNGDLPERGNNEPFYTDALYAAANEYNLSIDMGYAFKDIDGDGFVELFIMGRDSRLYTMFTISDGSVSLVGSFQQGMGYMGPDGMIFFNSKEFDANGSQIVLGNHMTHFVDGELVGFVYGWEDADSDSSTEDDEIYYKQTEDGVKTEISYDEYKVYCDSVYQYFWDYSTRLTKLNGLKMYSALINASDPEITADFSTYDAIIRTFGLMHSEVAAGKYVRTDWIKGAYDSKMHFESDEDYVIYNRLIASCVLVQNNSNAVFGYAIKDLNGDGVDELILLESNFYVLAIFTQSEDKAVLLDTYTDLRSACIDANGLIHVKQRIIPGNKEDYEYFVYEVGSGELVAKTAIGVKYGNDATADKTYKMIDGAAVDIDPAEWDALYAEYSADIGTTEFYTYTENEAGLTFSAVPVTE